MIAEVAEGQGDHCSLAIMSTSASVLNNHKIKANPENAIVDLTWIELNLEVLIDSQFHPI